MIPLDPCWDSWSSSVADGKARASYGSPDLGLLPKKGSADEVFVTYYAEFETWIPNLASSLCAIKSRQRRSYFAVRDQLSLGTMRISVLAALLAVAMLPLLPPALCTSDSEDESEGLDLSLRLGQRLEHHDAASLDSPATLASGSSHSGRGSTLHELTQLGHVPAPPSLYESQMLNRMQQAAAPSEASSSMSGFSETGR
ncbi:hypothetical protein L1887_47633 [Cichorium endivia]|nr:hypothetical protein L1887_47633 [Cichorium endivia]